MNNSHRLPLLVIGFFISSVLRYNSVMKNNKTPKSTIFSLILSIAAIVFCIVLQVQIVIGWGLLGIISNQTLSARWDSSLIAHCYDNNIKPCDDENNQIWNDAHPDEAFTYETWQSNL
jgi:hypothetical protein